MTNYLKLFLLLIFLSPSVFADYTKQVLPETALEVPPTNWAASDDATITVPLGFTFPFGAAGNLTQISLNSNGSLATTAWTAYSNRTLPRTSPTTIIAPYWDDIYRRNGTIRYGTLGTAPNRRFVAAWTNTPRYSNNGSCTFQAVLYENGDIRFRYSTASVSCNGSSATIGIQETTVIFDQHSYNSVIDLSKDILYSSAQAPPDIKLLKTSMTYSDPVNGKVNPKSIPGAITEYTLAISNNGLGSADPNSIALSDAIPANTALYVGDISGTGSGPVEFVNGVTLSGLRYTFSGLSSTSDDLSFSDNGGSDYDYSPVADALGVDSSVTHIRIATKDTFLASDGTEIPSFELKFRVLIQ